MLRHLPQIPFDENVLVGINTVDDAAVYKLDDNTALVQTLDFFTPIVDDPYWYGQVAAANSLSDVWAMGGRPLIALNIVCFPCNLDLAILGEILRGGAEKVQEAGALLLGGHTVQDDEPKYGLAVTGIVHPEKVWSNAGARPGDRLILTKPLGTGVISTAVKKGKADAEHIKAMVESMATLNKLAAETAAEFSVRACTDITGFGFLGHLGEMAAGSNVSVKIFTSQLPLLPGAFEYAKQGYLPGGLMANLHFFEERMEIASSVDPVYVELAADPQTSGGLLFAIPADQEQPLLQALQHQGIPAAVVGEFCEQESKTLFLEG